MAEEKTFKERLEALEESVQSFSTKYEYGWAKGEHVGAAGAATGFAGSAVLGSAEFTGVSAGIKLWNFDFDLKARLHEKKLEREEKDANGLDRRIKELKNHHTAFVRRITPIIGPINRQFPEVKSEVGRAHRRIDGLRDDLRDSRDALREERQAISRLRHNALQATPTLESLHRSVRTLATILGG